MKNYYIFIFSILLLGCSEKERRLKLVITDKEIHINHNKSRADEPCATTCAEIHFALGDESSTNYILYGFHDKIFFGYREDTTFCGQPGGLVVMAYTKVGKQIFHQTSIHSVTGYLSITPEKFKNTNEDFTQRLMNSKQIINGHKAIRFQRMIDFRDFELEPGEYLIKVLYSQVYPSVYISEDQLNKDKSEYNAEVYKGCLWTNPVRLIVD